MINVLYNDWPTICSDLAPILRIVGIFVKGIQIVVPILLIIFGMLDFAKAVTEKNDDSIKAAEKKLVNKAIAALLVFLVIFFVNVLMRLIGNDDYKDCMDCITKPFGSACKDAVENAESGLE